MTHPILEQFPEMAGKLAERQAAGMIAADGSSHSSVVAAEFRNDLIEWHANGSPKCERVTLQSRCAELRADGHIIVWGV